MDFTTTELLRKNCEAQPEIVEKVYGELVSQKFRRRYSQDEAEAVINNYLSDPTNQKYIKEMTAMQAYREECKAEAKTEIGM